MQLQKVGGLLSVFLAATYIFGMVFFLAVLSPSAELSAEASLGHFLDNRDSYFFGFLVIGFLFAFAMLGLAQATHQRLKDHSPQLSQYGYILGVIWAITLLFASAIVTMQLSSVTGYYVEDPQTALTIYRGSRIVQDALGGSIEVFGGAWVLVISLICLKHKIFPAWINYLGLGVALAGVLSLFSVMTFAQENAFFEAINMIFGLGQIPWFIAFGVSMYRENEISTN